MEFWRNKQNTLYEDKSRQLGYGSAAFDKGELDLFSDLGGIPGSLSPLFEELEGDRERNAYDFDTALEESLYSCLMGSNRDRKDKEGYGISW